MRILNSLMINVNGSEFAWSTHKCNSIYSLVFALFYFVMWIFSQDEKGCVLLLWRSPSICSPYAKFCFWSVVAFLCICCLLSWFSMAYTSTCFLFKWRLPHSAQHRFHFREKVQSSEPNTNYESEVNTLSPCWWSVNLPSTTQHFQNKSLSCHLDQRRR